MLRKCVFGFVVAAFSVGILSGAEMVGVITKVDGNKITFKEAKKKPEGEKGFDFGAEKTYTVAKDAKIMKGGFAMFGKGKGKGKGEPTALEGGLSNDLFKNIGEKGRFAQITTNDTGVVTEIRVAGGGKGKKKKDGAQ
jgi:hypothetical protein